ncbi:MAG: hypothetical protein KGH85_03030 [Thaumarchaeota archaeon]|nr:hypothetical protein [Nitrososphaerota archaeon]
MKVLVLAIAASITVAVIASISLFALPDNRPTCTFCPSIPTPASQSSSENNPPVQNVTTVIIPPGAEDAGSGKNYEPQYLHLVIGVNNTVKWTNDGITSSSVFADNHNDPDFYNATNPISQVENHVKFQNFLKPGESFEHTFTKVGYFGYHSEPHPWMRGWVLVLPQDTGNLTQTVVLNDTDIMGPCAIFEVPCPNTHIFTAQKFGANIYIEKMTINGVDNYAIVNPEGYCVYPTNGYRNPCTNTVDLAILGLVGVENSTHPEINSLTKTSIFDTGITPMSANVTNTNFTINYNISGGNVSEIVQDQKSNTLIVSLQTTEDGRLTLKIPRTLLDSKSAYSNQDTKFIILVDKQEVKYTETTSIDARTLTIPFGLGAKMIEITAPVNI